MGRLIRILSLSIEYPTSSEPQKGLFIRWRLQALAATNPVKVISPVALLDYANPHGWRAGSRIRSGGVDGSAEILHPRWLYPPRGGVVNAFCLFLRLLWPVYRLRTTFDVIDAHFAHPEGIAAALLGTVLRKPFVITLRGNELLHRRYRFRRFWMAWAVRRAIRVIAVSTELRDLAVNWGAHSSRVTVIPNGIQKQMFFPRDREECRRKHGLSTEAKVILSAGDLAELKGHHVVIDALRRMRSANIPAHLLIAGGDGRSGRFANRLREQVSAANLDSHVRFLGSVAQEQLSELMSAADVFCLGSFREGCPNVVKEALACGTPVVASDVGAVRQLLPDNRYGRIVPPRDSDALQEALQEALKHDWNRSQIASWGRARSWEDVASEVTSEMRSGLAERLQDSRKRFVIINADDLGISNSVNDAVFELMARGKITSATLIANAPSIKDAARRIPLFPNCSFGVHLNLTQFEPLSRNLRSSALTLADGRFHKNFRQARPSPALLRAIYDELSAQIERLISLGVPISHIDSHHHIHTVPFVVPVIRAVQQRYGIRRIRISKNIYADGGARLGLRAQKRCYNWALGASGCLTTEGFTELSSFCQATVTRRIPQRLVELMVHPGHPDYAGETALLAAPWEDSLPFPIRLINYLELEQVRGAKDGTVVWTSARG